ATPGPNQIPTWTSTLSTPTVEFGLKNLDSAARFSHDARIRAFADRVLHLTDGHLCEPDEAPVDSISQGGVSSRLVSSLVESTKDHGAVAHGRWRKNEPWPRHGVRGSRSSSRSSKRRSEARSAQRLALHRS